MAWPHARAVQALWPLQSGKHNAQRHTQRNARRAAAPGRAPRRPLRSAAARWRRAGRLRRRRRRRPPAARWPRPRRPSPAAAAAPAAGAPGRAAATAVACARRTVVQVAARPLQEALSTRGSRGSPDSTHLLARRAADQGVLRGTGCAAVRCSRLAGCVWHSSEAGGHRVRVGVHGRARLRQEALEQVAAAEQQVGAQRGQVRGQSRARAHARPQLLRGLRASRAQRLEGASFVFPAAGYLAKVQRCTLCPARR